METGGGEKRFHAQISWLMFVFSIFVIWVHSYNVDLFSGGAQDSIWILADQIENFVSVGLGQIAVPGFFLLSSYPVSYTHLPAHETIGSRVCRRLV